MITKIPLSIHSVKVISPMFSYGNGRLEPRPMELKGLLRNTYRIANPNLDIKTLYQHEVELFGGQLENNGQIIVNPLRIRMVESDSCQGNNDKKKYENLLLHKYAGKAECYTLGMEFQICLSSMNAGFIQKYTDLFHLSLLIGGIGKRSRRGRGCMTTDDLLKISYEELSKKTAELLNNVCCHTAYSVQEGKVVLASSKGNDNNRPYIKEIRFGQLLQEITKDSVYAYLKKVDQASHDIRDIISRPYVTGFVRPKRFASSVIVSLAEIEDGIVPVYTLLNAVSKGIIFKDAEREQNAFIDNIEEGRK